MADEPSTRGRLVSEIDPAGSGERFVYQVEQDTWQQMVAELLHEATFDAPAPVAAVRLGLSVAELEMWLRWSRSRGGGVRAAYLIPVGPWERMIDHLLLAIVADAGSGRAAAKVVRVPHSTLGAWVRGARGRRVHRTTRWGYSIDR
jgi:hypothetical protein